MGVRSTEILIVLLFLSLGANVVTFTDISLDSDSNSELPAPAREARPEMSEVYEDEAGYLMAKISNPGDSITINLTSERYNHTLVLRRLEAESLNSSDLVLDPGESAELNYSIRLPERVQKKLILGGKDFRREAYLCKNC